MGLAQLCTCINAARVPATRQTSGTLHGPTRAPLAKWHLPLTLAPSPAAPRRQLQRLAQCTAHSAPAQEGGSESRCRALRLCLSLSNTGTAECPRRHHSFVVRWQRIADVADDEALACSEANRGWARERLFIDRTTPKVVKYGARLRGRERACRPSPCILLAVR